MRTRRIVSTALRLLFLAGLISVAALPACERAPDGATPAEDGGADTAAPDEPAGDDATVTAFDARPVFFGGKDENRTVESTVAFPAGRYAKILLHVTLGCPTGKCDWWDRFGTLGVVKDGVVYEVSRFITPYRVGASWTLDVTALRPLLRGDVTLRGFIDTWVGPGHANGNGWLLTASFEMTGGAPEREALAVLPLWERRSVAYGDPSKPVSASVPPQSLALPAGASAFEVRSFITGHGQGNADNCAEFCERRHTLTVQGTAHPLQVWRDDCAKTAVPNQQGSFQYPRAGWCPGALVTPWSIDVTADLAGAAGAPATVAYDVESYVNTCRPEAAPDGGACVDCALGTGCAFDGGNHTEPSYFVSSMLVAYR
jgi:hypothetical protein